MRVAVTLLMIATLAIAFSGLAPVLVLGVIPVILVYMCIRSVREKDTKWLYQGVFAIVALIVGTAIFGGFMGPLLACLAVAAVFYWLMSGGEVKPLFPTGANSESKEEESEDV